jgi:hypothetical protein
MNQGGIDMKRMTFGISLLVIAVVLSACSAPASTAEPTATQASASGQVSTGVPTSLDPCQLITSSEASGWTGVKFGPGVEGSLSDGAKSCTYGANTHDVFYIEEGQAADEAAAKAEMDAFIAEAQANAQQLAGGGLKITQLPNFADGAVLGLLDTSASGIPIYGGGIGVRKGTIFYGFSFESNTNLGVTSESLQALATTVMSRLP